MAKQRLGIPAYVPSSVGEVISACWRHSPEERPSASIIMDRITQITASFICNSTMDVLVSDSLVLPTGMSRPSFLA